MEKLQLFLLIFQVIIAILMIICILIQRTGSDSLGGIGGGSGGLGAGISVRASANALTKFTIILVGLFMLNSLILVRISGTHNSTDNLQIDKVIKEEAPKNKNTGPSLPPVE